MFFSLKVICGHRLPRASHEHVAIGIVKRKGHMRGNTFGRQ
jgi:hypothetical protein